MWGGKGVEEGGGIFNCINIWLLGCVAEHVV